jgi:hypothetical protein
MKDQISWAAKYEPAMKIITQAEADAYFEECVVHQMRLGKCSREMAEVIERTNLGYWAGYHDKATRIRLEELFNCEHPILGKAKDRDWTPKEILQQGIDWGQKWKARRQRG